MIPQQTFIHLALFCYFFLPLLVYTDCIPQAPFLIDQSDLGVADIIPLRPYFGGANNNQWKVKSFFFFLRLEQAAKY